MFEPVTVGISIYPWHHQLFSSTFTTFNLRFTYLKLTRLSFKDLSWRQSRVISRCWCQLAPVNFLNHNSHLCTCIIQYSLFLKPLSIDSFHTSLINLSNFIVFYFIPLEITSHSKLRSSLSLHINIGWSEILRRNSLSI